jgi:hypothetical protein
VISDGSIVYLHTFRNHNKVADDILSEAYRYCLNQSIRVAGWLYGLDSFPDDAWDFTLAKKEEYYYEIRNRLDSTFEEVRKLRLHHMLNIIKAFDVGISDKAVEYGVDSYEYVFQSLVSSILGNVDDISMYYPRAHYQLPSGRHRSSSLKPDTVMVDGDSLFIIDSKFYRYGLTNDPSDLPSSDSVQKQLTYAEFAKLNMSAGINHIYNAFLIPADLSSQQEPDGPKLLSWAGYAQSDWKPNDEDYHTVQLILIDLRGLMHSWMRRNDIDYVGCVGKIIKNRALTVQP